MLGLYCDKKYVAMTNHDGRDDYVNEDRSNDGNTASRLVSDD